MWGLQSGTQLGEGAPWMRRERGSERAHCSWRMRPVSQKQVRFCPKVVIRPHKHSFNMQTHTHTQADTSCFGHFRRTMASKKKKARPTSVVWHSFAQSPSSPSQISRTSPPAPGQTVYASQSCHTGPGESSARDK